MNIDLLSAFLEIYRAGSLSAAATRLGISQPAVSGQLARLEAQLGEPLFTRSRHGVAPTARAASLAARIGPHVDGLRQAVTAQDADTGYRGSVRIAGAAELMTARVLPALTALIPRGLQLRVTLGLAEELLEALEANRVDLVVSAIRPVRRSIVATPLVDEEFVLVGPPALASGIDSGRLAADPVRALAHLPLISYAEELPIIRRYWRSEFGRRPPNPVAVVVPDLRAVLALVVAGSGVSVLPRYLVESALRAGSLVPLHQPVAAPLNTIYLAIRPGSLADPTLSLVHEYLLARARDWGEL